MKKSNAPVGLIVLADEPALFFSSISAAEGYLEAIDVDNGVYPLAYDAEGLIYKLGSDGINVIIEPDAESSRRPEDLRILLVDLLRSRGHQIKQDASLKSLLEISAGYTDDW